MPFNIFSVRTAEHTDGRLYPILSAQGAGYPMQLEPLGGSMQHVKCKGVLLSEYVPPRSMKKLFVLKGTPAELFITDCRLVIIVEKWNKGGRAWGIGLGATEALITNTARKIKEAGARRGTLLMGQIRYQWLSHAGYNPTHNLTRNPQIRLGSGHRIPSKNEFRRVFLDLGLKRVDTGALVQSITQKAARYWLEHGTIELEENRQKFQELAETPVLPKPSGHDYASYALPLVKPAMAETALQGVAGAGSKSEDEGQEVESGEKNGADSAPEP